MDSCDRLALRKGRSHWDDSFSLRPTYRSNTITFTLRDHSRSDTQKRNNHNPSRNRNKKTTGVRFSFNRRQRNISSRAASGAWCYKERLSFLPRVGTHRSGQRILINGRQKNQCFPSTLKRTGNTHDAWDALARPPSAMRTGRTSRS